MKKFFKVTALCLTFLMMLSNFTFAADLNTSTPAYLYVYNSSSQTKTVSLPKYSPFGESGVSAASAYSSSEENDLPAGIQAVEEDEDGNKIYRAEPRALGLYDNDAIMSVDESGNSTEYNSEKVIFVSENKSGGCAATRLYKSDYCDVFFEDSFETNGLSSVFNEDKKKEIAKAVAKEFEETIRSYVTECVGSYTGNDRSENGSIIILLEDIKDEYPAKNVYTAGYYSDTENKGTYNGNKTNIKMVHIDIYPLIYSNGSVNVENSYSTLAHEFTHLVETYITNNNTADKDESFYKYWFKEFFTLSVEGTLYPEENDVSRAGNLDSDSCVKDGAVLTYENYEVNGKDSISANYGLIYMLGKYINNLTADSSGKSDVLKYILEAEKTSSNCKDAFVNGVNKKLSSNKTLSDIIEDFYLAMTLCETSGDYSMGDEDFTENFKLPLSFGGSVTLKPGAAVVVPLFGEDYNISDTELVVKKFSPSGVTVPKSIAFGTEKYVYANALYRNEPCIVIDGNSVTNANANLTRHIVFASEDERFLNISYADKYVPTGYVFDNIKVLCRSVLDKNVYDVQSVVLDKKSDVSLNFYDMPKFDWNNQILSYFWIKLVSLNDMKNVNYVVAFYDENDVLLQCIVAKTENISKNVIYSIDLSGMQLNFEKPNSDKFKIKVMNIDNSQNLTPLSQALKITVKP